MSYEDTPDWMAALDQMRAGVADFAKVIHAYYIALVAEGFTAEQALALTLAFQAATQRGAQ